MGTVCRHRIASEAMHYLHGGESVIALTQARHGVNMVEPRVDMAARIAKLKVDQ